MTSPVTLREWVEASAGVVAPRAELEAFETGLLRGGYLMASMFGQSSSALAGRVEPDVWLSAFRFAKGFGTV